MATPSGSLPCLIAPTAATTVFTSTAFPTMTGESIRGRKVRPRRVGFLAVESLLAQAQRASATTARRGGHYAVEMPPSTISSAPVMYREAEDARNTAGPPKSSLSPHLRSGIRCM